MAAPPKKKEILQKVWKLISDHDGMVADDPRTKRILLDRAQVGLGLYVTSKPPSGAENNQNRRAALENLAESIRKEFKTLGLQTLYRAHGYWLERLDPRHRAGHNLHARYREWSQNNIGTAGESFWDHVDSLERASLDTDEHLKDEYVAYFLGQNKEKRALYKVHAEDGKLKDINNDPVNTGNMTTVHSGNGWGILIFNYKDELFVSSHKLNEFHHSTLMAGKPVKSAGDMATDTDGKVKMVTVKSGHYRPKAKHVKAVLLYLQAKNCIDHETMVRPSFPDWIPQDGRGTDDKHINEAASIGAFGNPRVSHFVGLTRHVWRAE